MSTLTVSTHETTAALADKLRGFGAKVLARIVGTSPDTTKKWLNASNAPTWRHTVVMLNDTELCPRVLEAAGRADLAKHQETIAALMAALAQVKADADANQERINALIYRRHEIAGAGSAGRADNPGAGGRESDSGDGRGEGEGVRPAPSAVPRLD